MEASIGRIVTGEHQRGTTDGGRRTPRLRRFVPLIVVVAGAALVYLAGWHRELALENVVRHRMALMDMVEAHALATAALFVGLYVAVVSLSLPGATLLSVTAGILFGTLLGGIAAVVGATLGATIIFVVARSAFGEALLRRAGPKLARLAAGFRRNAFSYLLFLRLVPVFPFFLVNLAAAAFGVKISTFVMTTLIGIVPASFAFALAGEGLDSAIMAQERSFRACEAAGRGDCSLNFDLYAAFTPQLTTALVALGILSLVPVAVSRWRADEPAA